MSGECTVTPGIAWSADPITDARLNQTANPAVRVDESAIGSRELNVPEVTPLFAAAAKAKNWIRNPVFAERALDGAHVSGALVACGAARWWRKATGTSVIAAGVNLLSNLGVADTCLAVSCAGAGTSTGGILLGQFFEETLARHLAQKTAVTVSFWFQNSSGSATVPRIQLYAWQDPDSRPAATVVYDEATSSVASGTGVWTRLSKTIDFSSLAVGNGFDLVISVPAALTTLGQAWRVSGVQLEIAAAATDFTHPADVSAARLKYSSLPPDELVDITEGYMIGDVIDGHNGKVYGCLDATTGAAVWVPAFGRVRKVWAASSSAALSSSSVIPLDNTIPQRSEGAEALSVTVKPSSPGHRWRVRFFAVSSQSALGHVIAALFHNYMDGAVPVAPNDAITATAVHHVASQRLEVLTFEVVLNTIVNAKEQTFSVRYGPSTGTAYLNQLSSGATLGGVLTASLIVEELAE